MKVFVYLILHLFLWNVSCFVIPMLIENTIICMNIFGMIIYPWGMFIGSIKIR